MNRDIVQGKNTWKARIMGGWFWQNTTTDLQLFCLFIFKYIQHLSLQVKWKYSEVAMETDLVDVINPSILRWKS